MSKIIIENKPKQRPLGRGNGKRIADEKIKAIGELYLDEGLTMPAIARQLDISQGTVTKYVRLEVEKRKTRSK